MGRIYTLLNYLTRRVLEERAVALAELKGQSGANRLECAELAPAFFSEKSSGKPTHSERIARSSDFDIRFVPPVIPQAELSRHGAKIRPVLWNYFISTGLFALIVATVVLYVFDPETAGFFPVCAFHQLTGLQCPGCGSLRALHQLAHGNIAAAWRFNPLLLAVLPLAGWLALRELVRLAFGWRWPGIITRPLFGWSLLVVTVVFGIARNLR